MNRVFCAVALFCLLIPASLTLPADLNSSEISEAGSEISDSSMNDVIDSILDTDSTVDEKIPLDNDTEVYEEVAKSPDVPSDEVPKDVLVVPESNSDSLTETTRHSKSFQSSGQITRIGHKGPCKF